MILYWQKMCKSKNVVAYCGHVIHTQILETLPIANSIVLTFVFKLMLNTWIQCTLKCHERSLFTFLFSLYHRQYLRLTSCRHLISIYFLNAMRVQKTHIQKREKNWTCSKNRNVRNLLIQDKSTNDASLKNVILIAENIRIGWISCQHVQIHVICSNIENQELYFQ